MKQGQIIIIGNGCEAVRCYEVLKKYGFDIAGFLGPNTAEIPVDESLTLFTENNIEDIASMHCPVVFAAEDAVWGRQIKQKLTQAGVRQNLLVDDSILFSQDTEKLIDALSFNSQTEPNEYVRCLLERYPNSAKDVIGTLADYQVEKIKSQIDPDQKTLAIYYPSKAYRANLGSEGMRKKVREKGYNVISLFGVIRADEYEKRPFSYYAGHDLIERFDFVDVFVYPCLTAGLPKRSKKVLFAHDIYDSPSGKDEAPLESGPDSDGPQHISPLLDELDYTFIPCRSLYGKTQISVTKYIRSRPLWRIPGGYIKLDRNIQFFESHKSDIPVDSIIYAPTVCGDIFENYVSLPRHGKEIVGALLANFPDYRIIFRPHPHTLDTEYVASIEKQFRDNERFHLDSNASFYMKNYSRSTVMITDMSGTAFTYAFTTLRPVVFFSHNEDTVEEAFNKVKYFEDRRKIGYVVTDIEQLVKKTTLLIDERENFSEMIREFRDAEIYNVGKAEAYFAATCNHIFEGTVQKDWGIVLSVDYQTRGRLDAPLAAGLRQETPACDVRNDQPHLIEEGHRGYNIVRFGDKYYGIAQEEGAFEIEKARENEYKRCFAGNSVNEVRTYIDRQAVHSTHRGQNQPAHI
ncbi:MAG: CDP-glycerol glycerophosphotransferase family protein [Sedimentisphaerales bacterium]|nr:CDP-glycerol glycerophosphotransferase family protein [Sedimentisphaerales bacterium]